MNYFQFAVVFVVLLVGLGGFAIADKFKEQEAIKSSSMVSNSATTPTSRLNLKWWKQRHLKKVKEVKTKPCDLLFIGDSITHSWENSGKNVWRKYFGNRHAMNIGFSGDCTEHVLWRLDHGEFPVSKPKVAVIMIGTNNTGIKKQKATETAQGIKAIVAKVHSLSPQTKILLLGVFPRDAKKTGENRQINTKINGVIKHYADDKTVFYLDIGSVFLQPNGDLPKSVMPDYLHPQALGYEMWAKAIEPTLKNLLK